ncbi:MAG: glucokinase, partial [Alphaproteobacteria bacterium]|nr:glucokinase [Alphaproteobacteria bacterium]
ADIGGTNARFALADPEGIRGERVLKCADYVTITDAVSAYLEDVGETGKIARAAFSIAGPVGGDRFAMTNLPWEFSIEDTRRSLGFDSFRLLNDFEALALGVPHLQSADVTQIGTGVPRSQAPIGVSGPGTGLGWASLFWDGARYRAVAGEGGHGTMPARTQREFDIFRTLRYKYRHVSAERVCSGKGLENVYNAIRILDGRLVDLPDRTAEDISAAALDGSCLVCAECLDLMMGFLGAFTGSLALAIGAHGGIYLVGGIINQLGDYFYTSRFREEFERKGRFEDYLKNIPTYVIQHDFPAFLGLYDDVMRES